MKYRATNTKVTRLKKDFNLTYPVFQAPAGGPAGEELAIAVANSGGMGSLAMTWTSPHEAYDMVKRMKKATKGNFFINFVLQFEPKSLEKALEAGAPIVQFSYGIPDEQTVSLIRSKNARLGIQVTGRENAIAALALEPDFLICQGLEAGGHVQSHAPLETALKEVLEVSENIPVLASGGIASGKAIHKYISLGASGVVMGTRFLATKESRAHDAYKQSLLKAVDEDTVLTVCFDKGWSNAPHRVLKNDTFRKWEEAGCPPPGKRPGEFDVIVTRKNGSKIERYATSCPVKGNRGAVTDLALYAGTGVKDIDDIPSVEELLKRIWNEYKSAESTQN